MKQEQIIKKAQARKKQLEEQGSKRDQAKYDELLKAFKKVGGTFASGPVILEPAPQSYGGDSDMTIRLEYKEPDGTYNKELMSIEFEGVDKKGEATRYYYDDKNPPVTMAFKRLSFYSTSGWDETELNRCILIGHVAQEMAHSGDALGDALFKVVAKYRDAIIEGYKLHAEQEKIIKEAQAVIDKELLEAKMKMGVKYLISHPDDHDKWKNQVKVHTGYSKWDYFNVRPGMSYEFLRETPTKYEVRIYDPQEQNKDYSRSYFKTKATFSSMVKQLIGKEKIELTATNI